MKSSTRTVLQSFLAILFATIFLQNLLTLGYTEVEGLVLYLPFEQGKGDLATDIS